MITDFTNSWEFWAVLLGAMLAFMIFNQDFYLWAEKRRKKK